MRVNVRAKVNKGVATALRRKKDVAMMAITIADSVTPDLVPEPYKTVARAGAAILSFVALKALQREEIGKPGLTHMRDPYMPKLSISI